MHNYYNSYKGSIQISIAKWPPRPIFEITCVYEIVYMCTWVFEITCVFEIKLNMITEYRVFSSPDFKLSFTQSKMHAPGQLFFKYNFLKNYKIKKHKPTLIIEEHISSYYVFFHFLTHILTCKSKQKYLENNLWVQ